ncbi:MAG: decarboxylating 6-phosphogluconate dehydrogenase [Elusimicrobiota bacterium]|nr:MAG: decarboxylating 6-phosphogluconate dehydrogenase [Elusimicrobiota bacterium]
MQIGIVGLGRMGANMARRLLRAGHEVVVYNRSQDKAKGLEKEGAIASSSLAEFAGKLSGPRAAWVMMPSGEVTHSAIMEIAENMERGDIIIDGGNSRYTEDARHASLLKEKGIHFVDCGTSGGVWGLERGYCLMIGGEKDVVEHLDPIFKSLAPGAGGIDRTPNREAFDQTAEQGYLYCGQAGAGHFVKMVHNGIEYGLMQAYAEGFDIMRAAKSDGNAPELRYDLPLADIAEVWRRGSVVASWLLDLTASALAKSPQLEKFNGRVDDSGEGRWTIEAAINTAVPCPVLTASLYARFRSRQDHTFADKLLSAMRSGFGGHVEPLK